MSSSTSALDDLNGVRLNNDMSSRNPHSPRDLMIQKVTEFVAEALDIESEGIDPQANLFEALGMDSVGIVYVHIEMAIAFNLDEPDPSDDLSGYDTVAKLVDYAKAGGPNAL